MHLVASQVAWVTVVSCPMRSDITGEPHLCPVGNRMGRQKYPHAWVYPIHHGNRGQAYLITLGLESPSKHGGLRELLVSNEYSIAHYVAALLRANMTGLVMKSPFT